MDLKGKLIIEAGHVTEVYGPVQALRNYVAANADDFIFITHPFSYTKMEGSEIVYYKHNQIGKKEKAHKRGKNQLLQWLKDMFFNIGFINRQKRKIDLFFGVDNLNALTGIIMKKLGKVDKVVYYIIDHTPRRFKNRLFNFLYEAVDGFACRNSDYIWSLSGRIAEAKNRKFKLKGTNNIVVPVGVELDKVAKFTVEEKLKKKTMILMSMLDETKGVQLLIDAMQDIIKEVPDAELLIIGTGPYEPNLREQAKNLKLETNVKFLGLMDHDTLFNFIPHHRIGMAPYIDDANNYTYFADPTKPKEYLGCGLPIVITDVAWVSEEVKAKPMGIVCKYNRQEITQACIKLLKDDDFYRVCLKNALDFASGLSWEKIYNQAFEKMK